MNGSHDAKPLPRGLAYAFVLGGMLTFAAVVDLIRVLFHLRSPISTLELMLIIFMGMALGGFAFKVISKRRMRGGPTPNTRWRGP